MSNQTDAQKRGRASRNKGANAERELAKILSENLNMNIRRGQVFNGEPDLVGLKGVHAEVKRQERINIHEALKQALNASEARQDGVPVVFFRRNRGEWFATMRLSDWMDYYRRKHEG